MTSVANGKDGQTQDIMSKAPWTDEQGIGIKIYQGFALALEILVTYIRMWGAYLQAVYHLFVLPEPKSVKGEVVLITGTGHGMGREIALRFSRLGAVVLCVDINATTNADTVELIKQENGKVYGYQCDVTNRAAVLDLAERVRRDAGEVTVLVNNAGIMPCKSLLDHNEREIRAVMDVNVMAHFWLIQAFLPSMMKNNHGHILAMSSMAGLVGLRNLVPYCASKFAVKGMMEAVHEELREDPKDYSGIKVTAIYPYMVDTGLCKKPKIRFPSLMKVIPVDEAADIIVDAMRRNLSEITIPGSLFYVNAICRALPKDCSLKFKDFLDSGLEPDDS